MTLPDRSLECWRNSDVGLQLPAPPCARAAARPDRGWPARARAFNRHAGKDVLVRFMGFNADLGTYRTAGLTYPERGATRGPLPPGYRHESRREWIGAGTATFDRAVTALLGWHMHRRAGFAVVMAEPTAEPESVIVMRLGPPVVGLVVPCRVVYTINEADRRGFAYGTLPGHPERGEEAFVVERSSDGQVHFLIRSFSRPATRLARAGGPLARAVQSAMTSRYVGALRQLSR
jgi:uncharacterized protein (UPF0548 family)